MGKPSMKPFISEALDILMEQAENADDITFSDEVKFRRKIKEAKDWMTELERKAGENEDGQN